jgi:hypothetical protein
VDTIDFNTQASLRKWPSLQNERSAEVWGNVPYVVFEGTLGECIRQFLSKAAHHLYEIHTRPQPPLTPQIFDAGQIAELAR